jgi:hypothetical protein
MTSSLQNLIDCSGKNAIKTWGQRTQMVKACEELAELIQALCKHLNHPFSLAQTEEVVDEVADVFIVAHQMRLLFDADKVDARIIFKLDRMNKALEKASAP